jgi:hypothetical protein
MGLVLGLGGFKDEDKYKGFVWLAVIFILVVVLVTVLVMRFPKNLVFSKEEHAMPPHTEVSALRDQITDLIHDNVKPDCLRTD